jgi:hypothetical protein
MYIFEIREEIIEEIREEVIYIIDENMDDIIDLFYMTVYIFQLHIVKIFF